MANEIDDIQPESGIMTLPIFPLPLVLLPGELLPLHIFEDRYRKMLTDIEAGDKAFGIILFEAEGEFADRPLTGSTGTVAVLRESETLADGRSNILTLGSSRFRLLDYIDGIEPYHVGEVELFDDEADDSPELTKLADETFELFKRIAKAAFKMGGSRGSLPELERTDPEALSFLITAGFNFENELKMRMIEMTSTFDRLKKLEDVLTQAVGQIEESADIQTVARTNGHSKKKLDL